MTQLRSRTEDAVAQRLLDSVDELVPAGLTDTQVELIWVEVEKDAQREIDNCAPWNPGQEKMRSYAEDIWKALGSPAPEEKVSVSKVRVPTMKAAHIPVADRAKELHVHTHNRGEIMYCTVTVQEDMTRDLIRAVGAVPIK